MADLEPGKMYCCYGDFYYYIEDVPSNPDFAICQEGGDDGYMTVCRKSDLKPQEETWQWQQKEKYAAELQKKVDVVQANLDELAEKVVDKALKSLASRIKLNVAFGKGGASDYAALTVAQEVEKMIRESGKKIAGKEDIDL